MWFKDSSPGKVARAMTAERHAVLIKTMTGLVDGLVPSRRWRSWALNVVIRGKCSNSHKICTRFCLALFCCTLQLEYQFSVDSCAIKFAIFGRHAISWLILNWTCGLRFARHHAISFVNMTWRLHATHQAYHPWNESTIVLASNTIGREVWW